ncbi:MAG: LPS export ABC transporter periplasmic protein LptC [Nitrospirae bacterium]|nr:LPS export ABC transporter periplasmic protein LptC [Nitrospirota bacterium]
MKKGLLVILSLILFSLFFFMLREEKDGRLEIHQKGSSFIEGLKIVNKKNGATEWILTAQRADLSENGDRADLSDIEMNIQNRGITLHAEKGTYVMSGKKLSVEGRILARGKSYSITSDNVTFDSSSGMLRTDSKIVMEGQRFSVEGRGMDSDSAEQKVRIHRDVKAVFYR